MNPLRVAAIRMNNGDTFYVSEQNPHLYVEHHILDRLLTMIAYETSDCEPDERVTIVVENISSFKIIDPNKSALEEC
ncbi:hypothetical protein [Nodosilinea nodulosa]|uniref:hypothetical protein n=1 Tax=Nodosilinea nodulosa TaxID=416001 RepID=UPI0003819496|nr:hypothetical protein [Nodosilinea nodulosa]